MGIFHAENSVIIYSRICHFLNCMSFFLLWNTKEDILRNVSVLCCPYNGSQWSPKRFCYLHSLKYLFSVLQKKETQTGLERHQGE